MPAEDKTPSTSVHVLADAIQASNAERRLLTTLNIRHSGAGALPVLRVGLRALRLAADVHPSGRPAQWVKLTVNLTDRVATASKSAPWLGVHSPTLIKANIQDLGDPVRSKLPRDSQDRLYAWLGLHLFKALSLGTPLPAQVIEDWSTLLRSDSNRAGKTADWVKLATRMPLEAEEISSALAATTNDRARKALLKTLAALDAELPEPLDKADAGASTSADEVEEDDALIDLEEDDAHVRGQPSGHRSPANHLDDDDASKADKPHSLLGWILKTAAYAGYRSHYGIPGLYGTLPPEELRQTCISLMSTMATGTLVERTNVAVAEVSLKSSLPPKLALDIPLASNGDLWLDLQRGAVVWNYRAVVDAPSKRDPANVCPVHIYLSDSTAEHLQRIDADNRVARSLGELLPLGSKAARSTWLTDYGLFLRRHGDDVYKAYSARFANSYHGVFHERHHGPVFAAFLSLDFAAIPPGLLHYPNIPDGRLAECQRDVDAYLGLIWVDRAQIGEA
jgi:hypothetical protein